MDQVFNAAFLVVAYYFGKSIVFVVEKLKVALKIQANWLQVAIAAVVDIIQVALLKYVGATILFAALSGIGFIETPPGLPADELSNIYYFALIAVSFLSATGLYLYGKLKAKLR